MKHCRTSVISRALIIRICHYERHVYATSGEPLYDDAMMRQTYSARCRLILLMLERYAMRAIMPTRRRVMRRRRAIIKRLLPLFCLFATTLYAAPKHHHHYALLPRLRAAMPKPLSSSCFARATPMPMFILFVSPAFTVAARLLRSPLPPIGSCRPLHCHVNIIPRHHAHQYAMSFHTPIG